MATSFSGAGSSGAGSSSAGYGVVETTNPFIPSVVSSKKIDDDTGDFSVVDGKFVQVSELENLIYMRLKTSAFSSANLSLGNSLVDIKTYGAHTPQVIKGKVEFALKDLQNRISIDDVAVSFVDGRADVRIEYTDLFSETSGSITL